MNNHHGSRGQVLPLVAICLVVLLGFGGMAVNVGYLQYEQRSNKPLPTRAPSPARSTSSRMAGVRSPAPAGRKPPKMTPRETATRTAPAR